MPTFQLQPRFPGIAAAWICAVLLLCGTPLSAQLRGTVLSTAGEPLPDVRVELWSSQARLAETRTDASGSFVVAYQPGTEVRMVLTRIGYEPLVTRIGDASRPLDLRMIPSPVPLPELVVHSARRLCPNQEDERARTLWNAARSRYNPSTESRGAAFWALAGRETVPSDRVGDVDEERLRLASTVIRATRRFGLLVPVGLYYGRGDADVARSGYGVRIRPGDAGPTSGDFFHWVYPALGWEHAYHFASDLFGELHTLSLVGQAGDTYTVAFCPRERGRPSIEGTLSVSGDSTFASASWSFRTPAPDEKAGGEVVFAPWTPGHGEPPHLLPARTVFWRREGGRRTYHQHSAVFVCWIVSSTPPPPILPTDPPEHCSWRAEEIGSASPPPYPTASGSR